MKKEFPSDSLSMDIVTGKYYCDLPEKALDRVAVEDGFLEFFKGIFRLWIDSLFRIINCPNTLKTREA